MKNVASYEGVGSENQLLAEIDRLSAEIREMLDKSSAGMERARRADENMERQMRELERQVKCWND